MPPRRGSLKRGYYSGSTCYAGSAILPTRQSGYFHIPARGLRCRGRSSFEQPQLQVTVAELGEHALLARLLARLPRPAASVLVGPGDDAAVLTPVRNERLVVTTDAVVEGVHFSRAFSTPADIGHKALAVNLSDLAAMAATPRWALVVVGAARLVARGRRRSAGGWALGPGGPPWGVGGRRQHHAHRRPARGGCDGRWRRRVAPVADAKRRRGRRRRVGQRNDRCGECWIGNVEGSTGTPKGVPYAESGVRGETAQAGAARQARRRDGPGARGAGGDGFERRIGGRAPAGGRRQRMRRPDRCERAADRSRGGRVVARRGTSTR